MTLDDFDWRRERLHVPMRKGGHHHLYPLTAAAGVAVIEYLRKGRRPSSDRRVFRCVVAPFGPAEHHTVSQRAALYLRRAGIDVRRAGSHTLRHSCVQRLVDAGFDLKTIGDFVGHRQPHTTQIYTKVSVESLREVALARGEGAL
jgi:site-specific recombinase XerD